jgi:hypothetical protein
MASPRKKNINIQPEIAYRDLDLKYWNELTKNNGYLPQSVLHEDIDKGVIDYFKSLPFNVGEEKIPQIFVTIQRWGEFTKSWEFTDEFENLKIPFISIIREPNVSPKEGDYRIPNRKTFPFIKLPIWDGNRKGVDIYKIPQPVPVIMQYKFNFFSNKMREVNLVNKIMMQQFASAQSYIIVNGHYFPLYLESVNDESQIDNESKRFYMQSYDIKCEGYLLDVSEFEVTELIPSINRSFLTQEISNSIIKKPVIDINGNEFSLFFYFNPPLSSTFINLSSNYIFESIIPENVLSYIIKLNGIDQTLPFTGNRSDQLSISIVRDNTLLPSKVTFAGKNLGTIN